MNRLRNWALVGCFVVLLGCGFLPLPEKEIEHLPVVVETVVEVTPTVTPVVPIVPHVPDGTPTPDMFLCELNNQHPYQLLVEKFDYTLDGEPGMGVRIVGTFVPETGTDPVPDATQLYVSCENAAIMDLVTNGDEEQGGVIDLVLGHMGQCGRLKVLDTNSAELKLFFAGCVAKTYEFPDIELNVRPVPLWGTGELES